MRLVMTPTVMERAYLLLCETRPFHAWKLPHEDDVVFCVTADPTEHGSFGLTDHKKKQPVIFMNQKSTLTLNSLLVHMAHEMCHLYQWKLKLPVNHGNHFQLLKSRVCKEHGFDPGVF